MKSNKVIVAVANDICAKAQASVDNLIEVKKSVVEGIATKGVDTLSVLITDVETVVAGTTVDEVHRLPEFISKLAFVGDEGNVERVSVSIASKLKKPYKYRKVEMIDVNDSLVANVGKFCLNALLEMYYIEEAVANVAELNATVTSIIEENEIPYTLKFEVDNNSSNPILRVSDKEIVFNVKVPQAVNLSSVPMFLGGSAYDELIAEGFKKKFVDALKAVHTPVQLIKADISLIKELADIHTKKRASKLIRSTYHRQAKHLDKVKTGIGYFEETVYINEEDVDIFALVNKREDGELEVILSPFDVRTLCNVDFNVIEAVKAQAA